LHKPGQSATAARSSVYRLLASLFARELTKENVVGFQKGNGRQLLDALETVEVCAPIATYLKTHFAGTTNPELTALDLAESYAWNFHGVGGQRTASLYASVYLSEKKVTHQEVEWVLRKIISKKGLSSDNPIDAPYDHLSVILEFVACLDEQDDYHQKESFRKEIIEKYLLSWLPAFVTQCRQTDRLGFYSDLAAVTLGFVETDYLQ